MLGSGTRRKKAKPSRKTGGATPLDEAWSQLTPIEFALWIRLCVEKELDGRKQLAQRLGYSRRWLNEILRQLNFKGFVSFIPGSNQFKPTRIVLLRQPAVKRGDQFFRV